MTLRQPPFANKNATRFAARAALAAMTAVGVVTGILVSG